MLKNVVDEVGQEVGTRSRAIASRLLFPVGVPADAERSFVSERLGPCANLRRRILFSFTYIKTWGRGQLFIHGCLQAARVS